MLFYHPFLDPYHCSYRMLRILRTIGESEVEQERFRAFDFYLLFPHALDSARLPQKDARKIRKLLKQYDDRYELLPDQRRMFIRLAPIQNAAFRHLASLKLIDEVALNHSIVKAGESPIDGELLKSIDISNARDKEFLESLTSSFLAIPFYGENGVRSRLDLFDDRYDDTPT